MAIPPKDDPFVDLRRDPSLCLGSYGLHIDAQRDVLRKVDEAKAFAKAVRADDAQVPIHLWNDCVKVGGLSKERRDLALDAVQRFCLRCYIKIE